MSGLRIELRNRHGEVVGHAVVDEGDAWIAEHRWYRGPHGYAMRTVGSGKAKRSLLLHRVVTQAPPGSEVDHLNHDTLDNRRANLRVTDKSGNMQNRSPWKSRDLPLNVYRRPWGTYRVAVNRKHVGSYRTVEEAVAAASAYRAAHLPMSAEAAAAKVSAG